ncbi:MAG: acetaldehyde dehydrogenase / alcohol dehydrogenase-like protein [Firmicutes bacterium]|nr:acetaldehyde dehydrogenase / alcohol dehydrogenase-like protein [Bacillota bacterium]
MQTLSSDLQSIQEARDIIAKAKKAQEIYKDFTQEQIDKIIEAMSIAASRESDHLAKLANTETGFGKWSDKIIKNKFASEVVYNHIKHIKTVGILTDDKEKMVMDVAVPVGIITALVPSTNPTSTVIYKSLIALKTGNAIVFSPHPSAKNCTIEAATILHNAAVKAGAPEGIIGCMRVLSMEGTTQLMKHPDVSLILATGGEAMVKAAYSSGTPAIGVGPGNGPAFIEKTADFQLAVQRIIESKTFDNGVICASEQSVIVESCSKDAVVAEFKKQGAYFLTPKQSEQLGLYILKSNGMINPQIVGKNVQTIANLVGITIPAGAKVLISEQTTVGKLNCYSREKLAPILAFYCEENLKKACDRCIEILMNEGKGHTLILHSNDNSVIREFALKMPVSRLLINTSGSLGGIGASTNLVPALTLGCGAIGGSATSDNVGPMNLINIRRVAYGVREN